MSSRIIWSTVIPSSPGMTTSSSTTSARCAASSSRPTDPFSASRTSCPSSSSARARSVRLTRSSSMTRIDPVAGRVRWRSSGTEPRVEARPASIRGRCARPADRASLRSPPRAVSSRRSERPASPRAPNVRAFDLSVCAARPRRTASPLSRPDLSSAETDGRLFQEHIDQAGDQLGVVAHEIAERPQACLVEGCRRAGLGHECVCCLVTLTHPRLSVRGHSMACNGRRRTAVAGSRLKSWPARADSLIDVQIASFRSSSPGDRQGGRGRQGLLRRGQAARLAPGTAAGADRRGPGRSACRSARAGAQLRAGTGSVAVAGHAESPARRRLRGHAVTEPLSIRRRCTRRWPSSRWSSRRSSRSSATATTSVAARRVPERSSAVRGRAATCAFSTNAWRAGSPGEAGRTCPNSSAAVLTSGKLSLGGAVDDRLHEVLPGPQRVGQADCPPTCTAGWSMSRSASTRGRRFSLRSALEDNLHDRLARLDPATATTLASRPRRSSCPTG